MKYRKSLFAHISNTSILGTHTFLMCVIKWCVPMYVPKQDYHLKYIVKCRVLMISNFTHAEWRSKWS